MPIVEKVDRALARALPAVFQNASVAQSDIPAASGGRHAVTLGELTFKVLSRLELHCGVGLTAMVDAPIDSRLPRTGFATEAGARLSIIEPAGFRVGIELNTLHVRYGAMTITDQTMMVALTAR